jgi:O-methyltransferase involved in polyketide biosynthesis
MTATHSFHDLTPLEQTSLPTLWCRTSFFRNIKSTPDLQAENVIRSFDFDFDSAGQALGQWGLLHLGHRAARIDELVRGFLRRHPRGTLVNIGCGFETLFSRIDNGEMTMINIDQIKTIEVRRALNLDTGRSQGWVGSIDHPEEWLPLLDSTNGILFIVAGVLMYLEREKVLRLFQLLKFYHAQGELIFDCHSQVGILLSNAMIWLARFNRVFFDWGLSSRFELKNIWPRAEILAFENLSETTPSPAALSLGVRLQFLLSRATRFSQLIHLRWSEQTRA